MAAFNFPASPSNGDTYTLNSVTYQYDGTKWIRYSASVGAQGDTGSTGAQGAQGHQGHQGLQGAQAHISTSAPSSGVNNGDLWWESDTGDLAIYYNDGNSSQWVDINTGPRGAQGGTGPTGAQGATGSTGAQGAAGSGGSTGAQGATGSTGSQGAAGSNGGTDIVNDTSPQLGGDLDCNNKVVSLNDSTGAGNNRLKIGNAGDLQLFHQSDANYVSGEVDGKDLYVRSRRDLHLVCGNNASGYRNVIYADNNGTARLYHPASNAVRLNTSTAGVSVTGTLTTSDTLTIQKSGQASLILGSTNAGGAFLGLDGDSNGDASGGDYAYLRHNTSGDLEIVANKPSGGANLRFYANAANLYLTLSSSGHFYPQTNNAQDLGTSSLRWRNLYTNDLNLSNEGGKNDVDGTWGSYTIQELSLIHI